MSEIPTLYCAKRWVKQLAIHPLKRWSQNFLVSENTASRIVRVTTEGVQPNEYWEIGPGLGALTRLLNPLGSTPLRLFEKDPALCRHLASIFPTATLEEGDVLTKDLENLSMGKHLVIVSNLPYNVSSPILGQLLPLKGRVLRMVMTFQKEFADRLQAKPRTKEYGALSVLMQLEYEMKKLFKIPPSAFYPAPNINSEVLLFLPKRTTAAPHVVQCVRVAFSHRRKKLLSNLSNIFPREKVLGAFQHLELNENTRAEELTKETFVSIAEYLRPSC